MSSYVIVEGDRGRLVAIDIDRVAAVVPVENRETYRVDMVKSLPILLPKESGLTIIENLQVRKKANRS